MSSWEALIKRLKAARYFLALEVEASEPLPCADIQKRIADLEGKIQAVATLIEDR